MNQQVLDILGDIVNLRERAARAEAERDLYKAMWENADKRADTYAAGIRDLYDARAAAA